MSLSLDKLENGEINPTFFVATAFDLEKPKETLDSLSLRNQQLDSELRDAVCANSDELLRSANAVKFLRDQVISLKKQVSNARSETEQVSTALIGPFNQVKISTKTLECAYESSKKLRVLLRFLGLARQAQKMEPISKISSVNNEIRRLCEIYRIFQSGELNGIEAYAVFWAKLKPQCEKMISVATQQFLAGIQALDSNSCSPSVIIFELLGSLIGFVSDYYNKEFNKLKLSTEDKLKKANADNALQVIRDDFSTMLSYIQRIFTMYESVISKGPESISPNDYSHIDPNCFVKSYCDDLKVAIERIARRLPVVSTEITNEVPSIRKAYIYAIEKSPCHVDRAAALSAFENSIEPFQEAFISQVSKDMRYSLIGMFSGKNVNPNQITQFCEDLEKQLSSYDRYLTLKLRNYVIKLAEAYAKLMLHNNTALANEAKKLCNALQTGFSVVASKIYGEETAQEIRDILSNGTKNLQQ